MRVVALALAASLAVAFVLALTRSASPVRAAPPLPNRILTGVPQTISSLRGKPALIDFFASWCGPCEAEAPAVENAAKALRGRASIIGVDWSDSRGYAFAFVRRFRWSFPVLADPQGTSGYTYGIQGLPTAFVLDAHGLIVQRLIGPQRVSGLVHAVDEANAGGSRGTRHGH